jgi:carbamoyl-phosphate synthase large subunit
LNLIREAAHQLGRALEIKGLMNLQLAIKEDVVYVLEVNPRASRTVPFLAKACGVPLVNHAVHLMLGKTLEQVGFTREPQVNGFFVKEALLPFRKFPGSDPRLGPEMRSTGEVMGQDVQFGWAFAKSQVAAGTPLPTEGTVLITVNDFDKMGALKIARELHRLGFKLMATRGTAQALRLVNLPVQEVAKVGSGSPDLLDEIVNGRVQLVINTPLKGGSFSDGASIRMAVIEYGIPLITTLSAAQAAVGGIRALQTGNWSVRNLQELVQPELAFSSVDGL